jgi:ubiquinone/menaquinone biosynthesis C-methylase UbiE
LQTLNWFSSQSPNPAKWFKFWPEDSTGHGYALRLSHSTTEGELPVPPPQLWLGYGSCQEEYLESGRLDVERMRATLSSAGEILSKSGVKVLDLGCGGGRMIRHFRHLAESGEVWGLDISAPHINWLKTHLTPPFHFAVNTTAPHLPFPDEYFDLVYCGSLFTHIDDLAEAWFLETRRVLAFDGILFCTIHDEHALAILREPGCVHPLSRLVTDHPALGELGAGADIVVIGHDTDSNVFYSEAYLRTFFAGVFDIVTVVPKAYGYQTAWVLRRPLNPRLR